MSHKRILLVLAAGAVAAAVTLGGYDLLPSLIAAGVSYVLLRIGFATIGAFARPVPEPPPAGELRRVRLNYRCTLCGTEVRMTTANDEAPAAPRHCMEEMEYLAPVME
ncbi:MAG: hypothetical protein ACKV2O_00845 [Acidimicrobiales bacterium]